MSVLFCDSNCELWFDEVERLGLKFISMPYTLEDTEYFYLSLIHISEPTRP